MSAKLTWETLPGGATRITGEDGIPRVPVYEDPAKRAQVARVLERWGALAAAISARYGVPTHVTVGMIDTESGGNPVALNREPSGQTGVGLMQPTHPGVKGKLTDEELFDPATNIECGVRYIASLMKRGWTDVPRLAAAYNAGSPYPPKPPATSDWGLHSTRDKHGIEHVTKVVLAANTVLELMNATTGEMPAVADPTQPDLGVIAAEQSRNLVDMSRDGLGFSSGPDDDTPDHDSDPDPNEA